MIWTVWQISLGDGKKPSSPCRVEQALSYVQYSARVCVHGGVVTCASGARSAACHTRSARCTTRSVQEPRAPTKKRAWSAYAARRTALADPGSPAGCNFFSFGCARQFCSASRPGNHRQRNVVTSRHGTTASATHMPRLITQWEHDKANLRHGMQFRAGSLTDIQSCARILLPLCACRSASSVDGLLTG